METARTPETSVSVRDLSIRYGSVSVIEALNLDVAAGEFIGLLDISEGEVWISGKNVTWAEPKDRGIGMVFQSYALYPRMSVAGNLSFGLKMAKVPRPEIHRRVKHAAALLHIEELMQR